VAQRSTTVRLPEQLLERGKTAAKAQGISWAGYIREAVAEKLAYDRGLEAGRREHQREDSPESP